jgi:ribonuclease J
VATLVLNGSGKLLGKPQITIHGLAGEDSGDEAVLEAAAAAGRAVNDLSAAKLADDAAVKETARIAIRRALFAHFGKKPVTDVHLVRIAV